MRISLIIGLIAGTALGGCSYVGGIFGGSDRVAPANTIADASSPLEARASFLAGSTELAFLSTAQILALSEAPTSISGVVSERSFEGFIIRGKAIAPSQGFTKPILLRDPESYEKDPANPVYLVRLTRPAAPQPVGNTISRQVIFAGFISKDDAASIRSVTLRAGQNQVRLRLR